MVTVDLRRKKPEPGVEPAPDPIDPDDLPSDIESFDEWLKEYRERLKDKDLYEADDYPVPGFDCDDYADALAEWLRKRFAGAEIHVLYVYWDSDGKKVGHAVIIIKKGGYY